MSFSKLQMKKPSQQQQQEEQSSSLEQLSPSEYVLFTRINNHLLFHFVPLAQFWQTQRLCVTLNDFQKMLQKINFKKGSDDIQDMKKQGIEFISLDKILVGVREWKRHEKDIVTFFQRQKQYLLDKKIAETRTNSLPKSSPYKKMENSKVINGILDLNSNTQLKSQRKSQNSNSNGFNSRITKRTDNSISHHYLAETSQKEQQALKDLNSALIRTKNESHYELTIKIGELNDICKKLKNDLCYLIMTKQNNEIDIIQRSSKSGHQKNISQKYFQKRYQELKTLNSNMMEQIEGTLEKDLRQTLVQVMFLSDQLQKQISLLKRKGINE